MKRMIPIIAAALLLLSGTLLAACGIGEVPPEPDEKVYGEADGSIYIYANSAVTDVFVTDFDTAKYDLDEFKGYLVQDIEAYNASAPFTPQKTETTEEGETIEPPIRYSKPVEIKSMTAKDGKMNLQLLYATPADFFAWQKLYDEDAFNARHGSVLKTGRFLDDPSLQTKTFVNREGEPIEMEKFLEKKYIEDVRYVTSDVAGLLFSDGAIIGYTEGASLDSEKNCFNVKGGQAITVLYYK